jgi:hypothetical protein
MISIYKFCERKDSMKVLGVSLFILILSSSFGVMAQQRSTAADPRPPAGGWWKEMRPGCEGYVQNPDHIATQYFLNNEYVGFRRGPNCNYQNARAGRDGQGMRWINIR